jgi:O-antigen/teichoic acid export membrane protein
MGLNIVVGLFYVPLLLHFLTIEQYGLYQLIGSLVAYLGVMDFGLTSTITRFYSRKVALNDEKGKENILAISMIIFLILSVITILIGLVIYLLFPTLYSAKLKPAELVAARRMLLYLVGNTGITIFSKVFEASITSMERFVFLRLLSIGQSILQPIAVVAILTIKAEALSIVQVQVIFNIIYIGCIVFYTLKVLHIRIKLHEFDKQQIVSILKFSSFMFLQMIFDLVIWRTGIVVLGAVAGPLVVAVFSIAIQINMYYRQFATTINSVLFPMITRLSVIHDGMTELSAIFCKVGRLQFMILGLILSGFSVFGKTFIYLWVGEEFLQAYIMTLIIMIPFTLDLIENVGVLILQAKDLHKNRAMIFLGVSLLTIFLTLIGTHVLGGIGSAIAIGVSLFLGHGIFINIYYIKIGIEMTRFFKELIPVSLTILATCIIGTIVVHNQSIDSWFHLGIAIVLFSISYIVLTYVFVLRKEERQYVLHFLKS